MEAKAYVTRDFGGIAKQRDVGDPNVSQDLRTDASILAVEFGSAVLLARELLGGGTYRISSISSPLAGFALT